jgi:hypothetical protein
MKILFRFNVLCLNSSLFGIQFRYRKAVFFSYVQYMVGHTTTLYNVHCVSDKIICKKLHSYGHGGIWARICKRLRSPVVGSKESIPPANVARRTRFHRNVKETASEGGGGVAPPPPPHTHSLACSVTANAKTTVHRSLHRLNTVWR